VRQTSDTFPIRAEGAPASGKTAVTARVRWSHLLEFLLVGLSPLLVVWPLRAQLWATTQMIDPYLHTALIQYGRDVLERFGADNRQFARAGFVVPGRLLNAAFGDIGVTSSSVTCWRWSR